MASHHTKDKGDMGVAVVIADLVCNGLGVFLPLSEHMPFDLIAVTPEGQTRRVQVKYRSLSKSGTIPVELTTNHSDRHGVHRKPVDLTSFDCFAVYCPESNRVYYVRNEEIPPSNGRLFAVRVRPARNNQQSRVNKASDFEGAWRIFN